MVAGFGISDMHWLGEAFFFFNLKESVTSMSGPHSDKCNGVLKKVSRPSLHPSASHYRAEIFIWYSVNWNETDDSCHIFFGMEMCDVGWVPLTLPPGLAISPAHLLPFLIRAQTCRQFSLLWNCLFFLLNVSINMLFNYEMKFWIFYKSRGFFDKEIAYLSAVYCLIISGILPNDMPFCISIESGGFFSSRVTQSNQRKIIYIHLTQT